MVAKMAPTRTTNIWNLNPTTSRPESLTRKEEDAFDVTGTEKDDESVMKTDDVMPTHVEIQRMIKSAIHIIQVNILDRGIEVMIETRDVSLHGNATYKATRAENTPFY